jgi:hypothetical protein
VVYINIKKEKVKKKINSRHRLVFIRLPGGEKWALKMI